MAFVMASITQSLMSLKYSPKAITFSYFVSKSRTETVQGSQYLWGDPSGNIFLLCMVNRKHVSVRKSFTLRKKKVLKSY